MNLLNEKENEKEVKYFEHYHCPFCEEPYSTKQEAYDCCLKNKNETVESQIFKRLVDNINLPTISLRLTDLNESVFKDEKNLYRVLKKIDKLEYKLWKLTNK